MKVNNWRGRRLAHSSATENAADCLEVDGKARASEVDASMPKNRPRDRKKRDSVIAHTIARHRPKAEAAPKATGVLS